MFLCRARVPFVCLMIALLYVFNVRFECVV